MQSNRQHGIVAPSAGPHVQQLWFSRLLFGTRSGQEASCSGTQTIVSFVFRTRSNTSTSKLASLLRRYAKVPSRVHTLGMTLGHKPSVVLTWLLGLAFSAAISQAMLGQAASEHPAPPSPKAVPSPEAMESFQSQMRDLRQQAEQLSDRARAAQAALRSIKVQMADMGLDMRLDVRETEARLTYLLDKIKSEIEAGDAVSAEADLQMAGYAADFIERFLGRG